MQSLWERTLIGMSPQPNYVRKRDGHLQNFHTHVGVETDSEPREACGASRPIDGLGVGAGPQNGRLGRGRFDLGPSEARFPIGNRLGVLPHKSRPLHQGLPPERWFVYTYRTYLVI